MIFSENFMVQKPHITYPNFMKNKDGGKQFQDWGWLFICSNGVGCSFVASGVGCSFVATQSKFRRNKKMYVL